MERAAAVHEALTHVVLTGGGPGDIAQILVEQLRGTVAVLDRHDKILAIRSAGQRVEEEPDLARRLHAEAHSSGRCASAAGESSAFRSVVSIRAGGTHFGFLSLTRHGEPYAAPRAPPRNRCSGGERSPAVEGTAVTSDREPVEYRTFCLDIHRIFLPCWRERMFCPADVMSRAVPRPRDRRGDVRRGHGRRHHRGTRARSRPQLPRTDGDRRRVR